MYFLRYCVIVVMLMLVSISSSAQSEDTSWVCPDGFEGQILHIYNWANYIAPETIDIFESICDVTVIYDEYESDNTVLIELRRGNTSYDIIIPGLEKVGLLASEKLLYPLDHERIPNMANIIEAFWELPQDPDNRYSLPYQWGTIGVGYNATVVDDFETWFDVFHYDGEVGWINRPQIMLGIALRTLGFEGSTTDEYALSAARDFLIQVGRDNGVIVRDTAGYQLLWDNELDVVIDYSGSILELNVECDCEDFVYVIPEEGTNLWFDMMAIPIDAPNPDLAHAFIDFVLDEHISAGISNATSYATPNRVAIDTGLVHEELVNNKAIYPALDSLERMFFLNVPTTALDQLYQSYWYEIIILIEGDL